MKKLNNKKLDKIYNVISDYDIQNSGLVFDISSLMKYCIEYELKEILKDNIGIVDELLMVKIFNSLNFNVNVNYAGNKKLIKYDLEYTDFSIFKKNYTNK